MEGISIEMADYASGALCGSYGSAPPRSIGREYLRCASRHCTYLVHTDAQFGGFCCRVCYNTEIGLDDWHGWGHGPMCEHMEAPSNAIVAEWVAPKPEKGARWPPRVQSMHPMLNVGRRTPPGSFTESTSSLQNTIMQKQMNHAGSYVFGIRNSDDDNAREVKKKKKTLVLATTEVLNFTFGIGMISLPVIFKNAGNLAFYFFTLAVGLVIATGWALGIVLEYAAEFTANPDYNSISRMTFGDREAAVITAMAVADSALYVVALFIMMGVNMRMFLPVSSAHALLLSVSCAAVVHILPAKMFSKVAVWSSCTTIIACMLVLMTGLFVNDAEFPEPPSDVGHWISAFGVPFYGCAFHVYYPAIYNSVPSRRVYNQAIVLGNLAFLVFGCAFGHLTYRLFGSAVQEQSTANIGKDAHGNHIPFFGWAGAFVGMLIFVKSLFVVKPAVGPILDIIMNPVMIRAPNLKKGFAKTLRWIFAVICYCSLSKIAEYFADYIVIFEQAVSLTLYSVLAIIFPLMCYMRVVDTNFFVYNVCIIGVVFGYILVGIGFVSCTGVFNEDDDTG